MLRLAQKSVCQDKKSTLKSIASDGPSVMSKQGASCVLLLTTRWRAVYLPGPSYALWQHPCKLDLV
jgi:hypothetical protein